MRGDLRRQGRAGAQVGENEDGGERESGERVNPGVICTGVGMRGEYFTRKIQLRLEDSQDT